MRTWAVTAPLFAALVGSRSDSRPSLLLVAGLVQFGDAALGIRQRNPGMTVGPAVLGCLHLASARLLRS